MPPSRPSAALLLAIPTTAAAILSAYLYTRPVASPNSHPITNTRTLSPSLASSRSLQIVNPRNHVMGADSHYITLPRNEIGGLGDEEILARYLRGYFGGWTFRPERAILAALRMVGSRLLEVGFTDVPTDGRVIASPSDISRVVLPEKYSVLASRTFMVLDHRITDPASHGTEKTEAEETSYVDVAFGDNRGGFAGLHRFEVLRDERVAEGEGAVTICYSSFSCNPSVNKLPFGEIPFVFHRWYAICLFRDAIDEVLRN